MGRSAIAVDRQGISHCLGSDHRVRNSHVHTGAEPFSCKVCDKLCTASLKISVVWPTIYLRTLWPNFI